MKNSIPQTILYSSIVIVALLISSFTLQNAIEKKETNKVTLITSNKGFAVLELFTSQGCSSCPPADAVLGNYALENNPNIIPLAFHVDYWNYIGWKDPFSKASFSKRQRDYSQMMNSQGNYTPQLIINGKHELVGSKENAVRSLVNKELAVPKKYSISIQKLVSNGNQLNLEYNLDVILPNTTINLALVKKKEITAIKRGENSGLKQTNYNIVFDFMSATNASNKASFEFKKEWLPSDFFVVAYLQNTKTGEILTATKAEIK